MTASFTAYCNSPTALYQDPSPTALPPVKKPIKRRCELELLHEKEHDFD
jgi:hypothetical protein